MELMDYIFDNATAIMQLLIGLGFFIFAVVTARAVWVGIRLMRKIDMVTDLFAEYIEKPLQFIMQFEKILGYLIKRFLK